MSEGRFFSSIVKAERKAAKNIRDVFKLDIKIDDDPGIELDSNTQEKLLLLEKKYTQICKERLKSLGSIAEFNSTFLMSVDVIFNDGAEKTSKDAIKALDNSIIELRKFYIWDKTLKFLILKIPQLKASIKPFIKDTLEIDLLLEEIRRAISYLKSYGK